METKINIAKLLKDCPKGMELDCTMFEGLEFDGIVDAYFPIRCRVKHPDGGYNVYNFTEYGCWHNADFAKCVIFPKGKTTWEGFIPPCKFKDGDIITDSLGTCIFKREGKFEGTVDYYCGISNDDTFNVKDCKNRPDGHYGFIVNYRLSTETEKQKLFDAIKANGYKWNTETKTLEKLPKFKVGDRVKTIYGDFQYDIKELTDTHYTLVEVEYKYEYTEPIIEDKNWELVPNKLVQPKFKVGDKVRYKNNHNVIFTITSIEEDAYAHGVAKVFWFDDQDKYELVPDKFDITTLIPFESKVLVRDRNNEKWKSNFWGFYNGNHAMNYPHECCGNSYRQCIPYNDDTKHLLGKTDDCEEFYKTWE